ncbi:SGNH/GDSL hydrolase family protein [Urechidicola croceus]|uniref:G-D-S-L family lipolytic protein n=1 Tax=Urechidicola croceus TaxID=1850246 RepID=A0A1D8P8M8_9FLAO|nr:G-D-S-L family lipolytic protein [Urechidicola croceus]AOW20933.1 G-D-S-L family lipolytic protein [Urechidicola croceus]
MNNKYKFIWMLCVLLGITSCSDEEYTVLTEEPLPDLVAGNVDFTNYVAIGASFTAGFTDNALFTASQENSFPNILAQQFSNNGGGEFTQPWMNDNNGGLLLGGTQITNPRLYFNGSGPAEAPVSPTTEVSNVLAGPFNNMGVPGAKSFHLVANGYGNVAGVSLGQANPYFARMASSSNASVLEDAMAQSPTFFTLSEVGGNDVLGYAISGGSGVDQLGNFDPMTYGSYDITDPYVFEQVFTTLVDAMTSNGAKGIVANLPNITDLPHFTTVPHNPVPLDAATASIVNQAYAPYNGGLQQAYAALAGTGLLTEEEVAMRTINFTAGQNAVVIIDEDLTDLGAINPAFAGLPQYRQATAEDLLVLPSSSFIGTLADPNNPTSINGVAVPLADNWVLTPEEQLLISQATAAYNTTIETVAASNPNIGMVDLNAILTEASSGGVMFDEYNLNTNLVFGGLVSLDGIHLTARGYALMANKFLEAIDANFETNFVESGTVANANDYNTLYPL